LPLTQQAEPPPNRTFDFAVLFHEFELAPFAKIVQPEFNLRAGNASPKVILQKMNLRLASQRH
jgi:hypothetical protein